MILFVDDEERRVKSYIQEFQYSGYQVEFRSDVDSALDFFYEKYKQIELLVLDVMMPPGIAFKDFDTKYGLRTGIALYRKIRGENFTCPILFLTNVSSHSENELDLDKNTLFLEKEDYLPFQLVDQVKNFVNQTK